MAGDDNRLRLYHTTSPTFARAILADGFQDHLGGAWLADAPTDDGARGTGAVLFVDVPSDVVASYELPVIFERWDAARRAWVPDTERPKYRAWCVPVAVLKPFPFQPAAVQPPEPRPNTRVRTSRRVPRAEPLVVTAYHEAAHAVVSYRAAGSADAVVSIVRRADHGTLGHCVDGVSDSTSPDDMAARVLSCYAGGHAQRLVDSLSGDGGCDGDDAIALDLLHEFGWTAREQEFRDRSLALVQLHWSEIIAVARELLRLRVLEDTEVEALADAAAGDAAAAVELARYRQMRRDYLESWRASVIQASEEGGA